MQNKDSQLQVFADQLREMFPEGFTCCGDRCPSNDHSNGDRDHTPHQHKSGGYAIRQR